jgi:hypothetical protein
MSNQKFMRSLKGALALVTLLAIALGSYASVHSPPTAKAKIEFVKPCTPATSANAHVNFDAVLVTGFEFISLPGYYVMVSVGEVVNKPIRNYPWINIQRFNKI